MKTYVAGDKSKGICEQCGKVSTTFRYQHLTVENSDKVISNILVAICDICGKVVGIPQQSTSEIKKQL